MAAPGNQFFNMTITNKDDTYVDVVNIDESDTTLIHKYNVITKNKNKNLKFIMCHECDTFIQDTKAIHAIDNTNIQLLLRDL